MLVFIVLVPSGGLISLWVQLPGAVNPIPFATCRMSPHLGFVFEVKHTCYVDVDVNVHVTDLLASSWISSWLGLP